MIHAASRRESVRALARFYLFLLDRGKALDRFFNSAWARASILGIHSVATDATRSRTGEPGLGPSETIRTWIVGRLSGDADGPYFSLPRKEASLTRRAQQKVLSLLDRGGNHFEDKQGGHYWPEFQANLLSGHRGYLKIHLCKEPTCSPFHTWTCRGLPRRNFGDLMERWRTRTFSPTANPGRVRTCRTCQKWMSKGSKTDPDFLKPSTTFSQQGEAVFTPRTWPGQPHSRLRFWTEEGHWPLHTDSRMTVMVQSAWKPVSPSRTAHTCTPHTLRIGPEGGNPVEFYFATTSPRLLLRSPSP